MSPYTLELASFVIPLGLVIVVLIDGINDTLE
jgi:hypothetical protein